MAKRKVKIPADRVSSGEHDSDCFADYYGTTRGAVAKKAKGYFASYHPLGYGTHFISPIRKHPDGYWCCIIGRWHSCD